MNYNLHFKNCKLEKLLALFFRQTLKCAVFILQADRHQIDADIYFWRTCTVIKRKSIFDSLPKIKTSLFIYIENNLYWYLCKLTEIMNTAKSQDFLWWIHWSSNDFITLHMCACVCVHVMVLLHVSCASLLSCDKMRTWKTTCFTYVTAKLSNYF